MKKFILLALNCIALFSFSQKPDTVNYKNMLTLEPLSFFASGLQLGYERQFGKLNAAKLQLGYYSNQDPVFYDEAEEMSGFNSQLTYKRFLLPMVEGKFRIYFGVIGVFKQITISDYSYINIDRSDPNSPVYQTHEKDITANSYGGGVLFGGSLVFINRFFVDMNIGSALMVSGDDKDDLSDVHIDVVNPYKSGMIPRLNFSIGYAF